ncbi:endonuclease/exonuclease/phosphatase family protein [Salinactinospora qingdaonensis]|uniref:Endonuclease/exonuclease/phosphatase domain-containing protein n=1 Tax=Salinactinospora qingdaonensis TaxID=702744 RepID=A0ABP7FEB7_9ACTN
MRVLTYNVRGLRDDPRAVARVITACRPDVVCLQEAPRLAGWRAGRRALARATGLVPAVNARVGGTAVFVRPGLVVLRAEHRVLRRYPWLHTRAVAIAVLADGRHRLTVASLHLDLHAGARLRHMAQVEPHLRRLARRYGAPLVVAGDCNEGPGAPARRLLGLFLDDAAELAPWGEAATFTARRPRHRIDVVFADPGVAVVRAGVPTALVPSGALVAASDHRPVLAELTLPRWAGPRAADTP